MSAHTTASVSARASADARSRQWLNDWAARPGLVARLGDWLGKQLFDRHPAVGAAVGLLLGGVGCDYEWASGAGHGLHGALTGAQLDNAPSYPDADAAHVAAVGLVLIGYCVARCAVTTVRGRRPDLKLGVALLGAIVLIGVALFEITWAIWHY